MNTSSKSAYSEITLRSDEIIALHGPLLSAICRRMTTNEVSAEKTAHDIWYAVLKAFPLYSGERSPEIWIYSIAREIIAKRAGSGKSSAQSISARVTGLKPESSSAVAHEKEKVRILRRLDACSACFTGLLSSLTSEDRFIYLLHDLAGINYPKIAEIVTNTETAVRAVVGKCRLNLQRFLDTHCVLSGRKLSRPCGSVKQVEDLQLCGIFDTLRLQSKRIQTPKLFESAYPCRNFWKTFLPE